MKKLLSIIASSALVTTSVTSVVACGNNKFTDIFLISDVGRINDKSFNESAYDGANKFLNEQLSITDQKISYLLPTTTSEIEKQYDTARNNGAKTLLLPGFAHQEHVDHAQEVIKDSGTAILLDGSSNDNKDVIGVQFNSEMSGFYAGVASILYMIGQGERDIKLSAYGGLHNPTGVTNFISGYMASIEFINQLQNQEDKTTLDSLIKVFNPDKSSADLNSVSRVASQKNEPTKNDDQNWFSGSFGVGGGKAISEKLISEGANIIFPVAGPQTEDTLGTIKERNKEGKVFVVGVDTDQVQLYKNYKNYFITSASKTLSMATQAALINSKVYEGTVSKEDKAKYQGYEKDGTPISGPWDGHDVWFNGDISYGSDNKVSEENYRQLMALLEGAGEALSETYHELTEGKNSAQEILDSQIISKMGLAAAAATKKI
ncbi:ribose/galactose ABC transporter substrate-binding protein [Spiroplasma sabaudiense Ar-1343]|uniref:Ribose/galactose ABC transporter substrate-binding protein n=1 Tax=Spiroplasma sabaudiense Ar-1343 TaxID=1276257 RepID=W6AIF8_9MOLU|nr:BMP family ABC transporter substrate-binding protein [Spiroplasma sabaudiense]AHI53489.1 ribose/galactose ABC transporter substrate-binding protein [Spiroplasma sabaudiense Ar-1343]